MKSKYDIAIIGTGPAGLSAALNCYSRGKDLVLIGPKTGSKKVKLAERIDNYLGLGQIEGEKLNEKFLDTIETYALNHVEAQVNSVYALPDTFFLELNDGNTVEAAAVIVATGVATGKKFIGEDTFLGKGVSYCATCDGNLNKGKVVAVIGDNEEAISEANFLQTIAKKTYYIDLGFGVSNLDKGIEVIPSKSVKIVGNERAEKLILDSEQLLADSFFVIKEARLMANLIPGIEMNRNHVLVNRALETNLRGVYACGDITGLPYQISKAVGEGNVAGLNASKFVERLNIDRKL